MRLILLFAVFIFFLSCGKNDNPPATTYNPVLTYKVHDSIINIPDNGSNIYLFKTAVTGSTQYSFTGAYQNAQAQFEGFTFIAVTDSLKEGTYTLDSAYFQNPGREFSELAIIHNGNPYLPLGGKSEGSFTLIITKYSGGEINGTFSGTLVSAEDEILNVSEGRFTHVKVVY